MVTQRRTKQNKLYRKRGYARPRRRAPKKRGKKRCGGIPRSIRVAHQYNGHKMCCGNVQNSRIPDSFSGTSLAVRGRTEFLIRPDQHGRLAFVFNPNSIKAPVITNPHYHSKSLETIMDTFEDFWAEKYPNDPNPHPGELPPWKGWFNPADAAGATAPNPWLLPQNLQHSYGQDVTILGWGYDKDSGQIDKGLTIKRSQAYDEISEFADKYRVTNARMVVRYIGNDDANQGIFTCKEFVPKGNVWGWAGTENVYPTRIDTVCSKTTHMAAKDGMVYTPIVNSIKKNLKFLSIDDHEASLGGAHEFVNGEGATTGRSIESPHVHKQEGFLESFKKMAAYDDLQETNLGMQSLIVMGNSLKTTAQNALNPNAQEISQHASGDAAWHVEIIQDIELTITTGSFQERMASAAPSYDPVYERINEQANEYARNTGSNLKAHTEGWIEAWQRYGAALGTTYAAMPSSQTVVSTVDGLRNAAYNMYEAGNYLYGRRGRAQIMDAGN